MILILICDFILKILKVIVHGQKKMLALIKHSVVEKPVEDEDKLIRYWRWQKHLVNLSAGQNIVMVIAWGSRNLRNLVLRRRSENEHVIIIITHV